MTAIPDPSRFTNNPNDIIALESMIIVVLCFFIIWLLRRQDKKEQEINKTLQEVAKAVNVLTGVINAKE